MNNKVLVAIIAVLILGAGGYFFINFQRGIEDTNGNPVAQSHRIYEVEVTSSTDSIRPQQLTNFSYKIKNDKGELLKNYEIAHEKIMHFILVRKDLQNFQHLHPDFNQAMGEFTVNITFQTDGSYRLFPDFTPGSNNPQKLPVTVYHDVDVGNSNEYYAQSVVPDTEIKKTYKVYDISFDFPKDLQKEKEITFRVSVAQNGKPVINLESYLGALGHSVILKEETLDFIHTHALEGISQGDSMQEHNMNSMQEGTMMESGPDIKFAATFPESGVYKIFTQFKHEGKVQTVDYIVKVN